MANVNLYQKFDYTDADGNSYADGSTSTAKTINIDTGEIFDRTYSIASGTLTEILNDDKIADFDFLWIESDQAGEIQLLCNQDGDVAGDDMETGFVIALSAGKPFILTSDASRNLGDVTGTMSEANYVTELNTWESTWNVDTIDRIEWYHSTSVTAKVRVFAAT